MKPITLKLSGLQSYREMQQIDFEDLCDMGLFGIFGPTGSGKSTLLDAMTLALYGKVERAVNGTQGIMNHSEDSLFVSFSFELASAEGKHRYRVERRFKRTSELSVSNTVSRFIEITDEGENVVADKLAEVTRCVEDKIGLKMDDFTRAVVLPQGKFAEFLSLKGSERRQMLQRLFHLEKYGDQLGIKLSRRVKENDGTLRAIEAEQQGLGEAGEDALKLAEQQLKEATAQAEAIRAKLNTLTKDAEEKGKIRERQLEKHRKQSQLDQLRMLEDEMRGLEQRLDKSAAASGILPSLVQWRESRQEWKQKDAERAVLQTSAQQAEEAASKAAAIDEAAQEALASSEPKLLQRQEQLEQAVVLQKERDATQSLFEQLVVQHQAATENLKGLSQSLAKEQELLNRGSQKQSELQEKLNGLEVSSKERDMLQKALQLRQLLVSGEERRAKAQAEMELQQEKLSSVQRKHEQSSGQLRLLQEQEKELANKGAALLAQAEKQAGQADRALVSLERDEHELNEVLKQHQLRSLSRALAAELHDGQPCPVCGSLDHPVPAHAEADETGIYEETLRKLQEIRARVQDFKYAQRQIIHECSALGDSELADAPKAAGEAMDYAAASAELADAAPFSAAVWEQRIDALEASRDQLSEELSILKRESSELREKYETVRQQTLKLTAETEAGSGVLEQLRTKLEQINEEMTLLRGKWSEELPELPQGAVETRWAEMQQKDREAEEIKERLRRSVPFLEEKKSTVQAMERSLTDAEKQLVQLEVQLQGKRELLNEKQQRLQAWIGDQRAEILLEACIKELKTLRETAARQKALRQSAEQEKHESAKAYAMACQAADSASAHQEAAGKRWEKLLADSPFAGEADVEEAYITPEQAEQLAARVRTHRDGERDLLSAIRHIEEQLLGCSLTEEEWMNVTRELSEARLADEEALQAKARSERDLEDIRKRHARWTELEKLRLVRQGEAEKLSKLQSCLRGNAFVEYIAEEQLMQVSQSASQRLGYLTKQRYALEVDSGGGFLIRDDANGGVRRPVSTLSGGETFLTSLSLALALSAQIQLRGQYPLQFFFLDEGFGTLDPELLETVITSLEKLHSDHLSVGVISHVPELRARLPRKLVVIPAEQAGGGSKITVEQM